MESNSIKQWLGLIFVILYLVVYALVSTSLHGFDLVRVLNIIHLIPFLGLAEILYNPMGMILIFILAYLLYRRNVKSWTTRLVFLVSLVFSGVIWTPSPWVGHIDFLVSFMNVTALDFMVVLFFRLIWVHMEFFTCSIIQFVLSIIILESVLLVVQEKIKTYVAAGILLTVTVIWSFLPGLPLLLHPYVGSVFPLPIGPLLALIVLPFINRPVLRKD